jgi:hypothetical protein
MNFI